MTYVVKLTAPAEREAVIAARVASSARKEDFYEFRGTKHELPVVRVPLELPIYRMENFRAFTDQHEYVAKEGKEETFFAKGQEIESVQQVQHAILARLSAKGVSDSVVPVADVLRKEKQREPLLITSSGVMVNGNRRLAAMRELFNDDPQANSSFSHVDAMILPADSSADEIVDIEASLQAKRETKLDYDWIGDAQLISRLINMGRTPAEVAIRLDRSEKEIKNSLKALAEADLYLKEWAQAEGEYTRVSEDGVQLFKDLPKLLEGKDAGLEEASRVIAWSLFDNREKLPGRLYNFNAAIGSLAADVLDRTATALRIQEGEESDSTDDGSFSVDVDDGVSGGSYHTVIEALKDGATKAEALDTLIDACETAIETEKGQKSGQAGLKALNQAHAKLAGVDLSRAARDTYGAMGKQLESIQKLVSHLVSKLGEMTR